MTIVSHQSTGLPPSSRHVIAASHCITTAAAKTHSTAPCRLYIIADGDCSRQRQAAQTPIFTIKLYAKRHANFCFMP